MALASKVAQAFAKAAKPKKASPRKYRDRKIGPCPVCGKRYGAFVEARGDRDYDPPIHAGCMDDGE